MHYYFYINQIRQIIRLWLVIGISLVHMTGLVSPQFATAQTLTLNIESCNHDKYPVVTCVIRPVDINGLLIPKLDKSKFIVEDDGKKIESVEVTEAANPNVKISVALVLDISSSLNGKPLEDLKKAAEEFLNSTTGQGLSPTDRAALIGFNEKIIIGDASKPTIDESKEQDFTDDKNKLINTLRGLIAKGSTPLFDALVKSVYLTRREAGTARAIVVMSDGRDVGSGRTKDDPITEAKQSRIPVFAIGFGNQRDDQYLERLSNSTGGWYRPTPDLSALLKELRAVQDNLKTQYSVSFTALTPADGKPHSIKIKVETPNGRAEADTSIIAQFGLPNIRLVEFEQGGQKRDLAVQNQVGQGVVRLIPAIDSRFPVVRVIYEVNGKPLAPVTQAPFAIDWPTGGASSTPQRITIKAYDNANPPNEATRSFDVIVVSPGLGIVPSTTITTNTGLGGTTGGGTSNVPVLVVIGVISLILLGLLVFMLMRRRQAAMLSSDMSGPTGYPDSNAISGGQIGIPTFNPISVSNPNSGVSGGGTSGAYSNMTGNSTAYPPNSPMTSGSSAAIGLSGFSMPRPSQKTTILRPNQPDAGIPKGWLMLKVGGQDRRFTISSDGATIGRSPENSIAIDGDAVSNAHARIKVEEGKVFVYDLASTNGSKVNGTMINGRTQLHHGDNVEFGDIVGKFIEA